MRHAIRKVFRDWRFSLFIILALALGVGVNTAVFSVMRAVLLKPLPFANPDSVVLLQETNSRFGTVNGEAPVRSFTFRYWQEESKSFEQLAAMRATTLSLTGAGLPESVAGAAVSANLFSLLKIAPQIGRTIEADDDEPRAPNVVLISDALWRNHLGGDATVLGRSIALDGAVYTIIGVMPFRFTFPGGFQMPASLRFASKIDVWTPLRMTKKPVGRYSDWNYAVIGRMRPGVGLEQAQREQARLMDSLRAAYPPLFESCGSQLVRLKDKLTKDSRSTLLVLLAAAASVLLIACLNISNLMFVRTERRRSDFSTRAALGATPGRLVGELFRESCIFVVLGAVAGLVVGTALLRWISIMAPASLPRAQDAAFEWQTFALHFGVAVLAGLAFSLAPAYFISRLNTHTELKNSAVQTSGPRSLQRIYKAAVFVQVAVSVVLLVAAGLLAKTLIHLLEVDIGVARDNVLTMQIALPVKRYQEPEKRLHLLEELIAQVRSIPGVVSAGAINNLPLTGNVNFSTTTVEGVTKERDTNDSKAEYRSFAGEYFRTMGIPLLSGRLPNQDQAGEVVVSASLTKALFGQSSPGGRRIKRGEAADDKPWLTIVGVVGDVRNVDIDQAPRSQVYGPYRQNPLFAMSLGLRTSVDPLSVVSAVRIKVAVLDSELPVANVRTMNDIVTTSTSQRRFYLVLAAVFCILAVALTGIGVFGLASYAVQAREREFGIRMVMGADRSSLQWLVIRQHVGLVFASTALGLLLAANCSKVLSSLLYEVGITDPITYLATALFMLGLSFFSVYGPVRRMARLDPAHALREE